MNQETLGAKNATESMAAFLVQCAVVFGAILFASGWYYGHAYYGVFGVGLTQLEIPVAHYLVWIHPLVFEYWYFSLTSLLFTVIILTAAHQFLHLSIAKSRHRLVKMLAGVVGDAKLLTLVGVIILIVAFPLIGGMAGRDHAERDLYADTTTLPVAFLSLRNPEGDSNVILRLREIGVTDGEYYLLGRHRGAYYAVPYQLRSGIGGEGLPRVVILPEAVVASIRIRGTDL